LAAKHFVFLFAIAALATAVLQVLVTAVIAGSAVAAPALMTQRLVPVVQVLLAAEPEVAGLVPIADWVAATVVVALVALVPVVSVVLLLAQLAVQADLSAPAIRSAAQVFASTQQ